MMNMEPQSASRSGASRRTAQGVSIPHLHRMGGYIVSLASDIGALEECLALERSSRSGLAVPGSEGIQSPPAVPYCELLTVRTADGRLQAVCRLMRLDQETSLGHPLKTGRFRLSPLITAIRYSREGVLEMGAIAFASGCDQEAMTTLIWRGMVRFLERNGLGFVLGQESLSLGPGAAGNWPGLMARYGLHPDLEVESRAVPLSVPVAAAAFSDFSASPLPAVSVGLRHALCLGGRLVSEPVLNPATGCHAFVWVASREMLTEGEPRDWGF